MNEITRFRVEGCLSSLGWKLFDDHKETVNGDEVIGAYNIEYKKQFVRQPVYGE